MAAASTPDREYRAFLAGIGEPEAFEPRAEPSMAKDASEVAEEDDDASYAAFLHADDEVIEQELQEAWGEVPETVEKGDQPPAGRSSTHRDGAWPALIVLLLILGGLPSGPDLAGPAMAGEKKAPAAAEPAAAAPVGDPELEVAAPVATEGENVASDAAAPATEGEPPAEGGEGASVAEEDEAPPPGAVEEVEGQAEALLAGKKFDEAVDLVRQNDALIASSPRLLEIMLEAGIQTAGPNWLDIGNRAQELLDQNPTSPLGNLALGMSWANRKKADLGKALEYLGKANASKRALPMTAKIYWTVWATKNWPMLAGIIGGLAGAGFVIARKRKQKRMAAAELEKALTEAQPEPPAEGAAASTNEQPAAEKSGVAVAGPKPGDAEAEPVKAAAPKPAPKPAAKPAAKPGAKPVAKPGAKPAAKPVAPKPAPVKPAPAAVAQDAVGADTVSESEPMTPDEAASEAPAEPPPAPVPPRPRPVVAEPPKPAPARAPAVPAPDLASIDLASAHLHSTGLPPVRPAHLPGREAEAVWQNLVRQATTRPIPLDVREPASPPPPPPIDVSAAGEITMDLSEKSTADELVTKLRMLAITDGELRTLLQLRNPEHLPALVEYISMKPDPVRLAFLAREMGHYHDPAVSDILSTLLYHPDHRVGLSAIQGLQINGGVEAVLAICPFLESEVPVLVDAARTALMDFGPRRVLEGIARLPSHPDERVRSAGVLLLSRMKGAPVARLLVSMLGDRSANVRQKAILAMAFQKDPAYLTTLREFVRQAPEEDRKVARKAIVFLQTLEKP
ncbi:MAG TPA: HEAT repeat domain-containing protein [Candidatus Ozemobacteraceae bacterium]|nr:HEAT repeat domain-containing protein [Candidatus Ozemobacteraceae bacterium]